MVESKRIRLSNQIALVLAVIMAIWAVVVKLMATRPADYWSVPSWDLALALGFLLIPGVNRIGLRTGWTQLGRNLLITLVNATFFVFPALFGPNSGTHYCFLPATALPFALFETRRVPSLIYGAALPMLLFMILVGSDFNILPRYAELPPGTWVFWFTVFCSFLLSFVTIYLFSRANERAEAELRLSERKYGQIVELAREGIWVTDPEGRTIYLNPALLKLLGETAAAMKDKTILDFVDGADRHLVLEGMERRRRGLTDRFELRMRRRDGRMLDTFVSVSPVADAEGRFVSTIALIVDMTEARARDRLIEEQRIKMLATAKLSSLGEMAAGIAHEINNPMMAMNLKIGLLERRLHQEGTNRTEILKLAEEMKSVVRRVSRIIDGLRHFSHEDQDEPMRLVPVAQVIEETLSFCAERFQAHGVELSVPRLSEELQILCRPVQISQVLLNLLNNAFDAVTDQPRKRIEISVERRDSGVEIAITDSGHGVPAELREKIFQPFFTTKPFGRGTGLGLSVSRGILEAHHGQLVYEPASSRMTADGRKSPDGSRFKLWIPSC